MKLYLKKVMELVKSFNHFSIIWISKDVNSQANKLSKLSSDTLSQLGRVVIVKELFQLSIEILASLGGEIKEVEES